ncbi:hypothetical protein [Methylobacterium symbioticum]|uniref:Uncharacterized protein n=1 Tax=Methylobacterium symbioticum TaxID=2584084 RepID=A0A509EED5_9HYPH|nr:hypothetical protein [Methylobacterium symbioticum]VUD71835.1 hypothetical protein MET9862_02423 [Methylobacterium symbioticum]
MIGFASSKLGMTKERVAFWLAAGCGLVLSEGVWRLEGPTRLAGPGPAPAPVPEKVAREAIAGGARVVLPADDLFGRAA